MPIFPLRPFQGQFRASSGPVPSFKPVFPGSRPGNVVPEWHIFCAGLESVTLRAGARLPNKG